MRPNTFAPGWGTVKPIRQLRQEKQRQRLAEAKAQEARQEAVAQATPAKTLDEIIEGIINEY